MASTAVATTKSKAVAVNYNPAAFDYTAAAKRAERFATAVGGTISGGKRFPGEKYMFGSGDWYFGTKAKKAKTPLKSDPVVAVNIYQAAACWVKWVDQKPTFTDLRMLDGASGELELREDLGDMDQDEWEKDLRTRRPMDPWKPVLVFPVRAEDGDVINHIDLQTKSSTIAGFGMYRDILAELSMHTGELPLVKLGSRKVESKSKLYDEKKKKDVEVTNVYDVPTFEIVGWTDMKACDTPEGDAPAALTDEVGEVSATERSAPAKPTASAAKPAAKGKKKVEVADDEI